mmetsp:Transcript_93753/g.201274  ORF Transcript_93753/g.201274 Transcript_93753/m.201274 type:complete len:229 (-) Transcript_93753:737-1423(-)
MKPPGLVAGCGVKRNSLSASSASRPPSRSTARLDCRNSCKASAKAPLPPAAVPAYSPAGPLHSCFNHDNSSPCQAQGTEGVAMVEGVAAPDFPRPPGARSDIDCAAMPPGPSSTSRGVVASETVPVPQAPPRSISSMTRSMASATSTKLGRAHSSTWRQKSVAALAVSGNPLGHGKSSERSQALPELSSSMARSRAATLARRCQRAQGTAPPEKSSQRVAPKDQTSER